MNAGRASERLPSIFLIILQVSAALLLMACNKYENNTDYIWSVDVRNNREVLVKGSRIDSISSDIAALVFYLNRSDRDPIAFWNWTEEPGVSYTYPKIQLVGLENGRATVRVINDWYLTQSMGTSGAWGYVATVVCTLTEHPEVDEVYLDFNSGDHAMPGLYRRADYETY